MKIEEKNPPRKYRCGLEKQIEVSDCGSVYLEADEQLTFVTPSGAEHDFAAKSWGFYSTPSVNGRLVNQGFRVALVRNSFGKYFIMTVERGKEEDFNSYLEEEKQTVVEWLSDRDA